MKKSVEKLIKGKKYFLIHKPIDILSDKHDSEVNTTFPSFFLSDFSLV